MQIRWAQPADYPILAEIYFRAIHEGPSPYSAAQRTAWAAAPPLPLAWVDKLASQSVAVAEMDQRVVGFMTLAKEGYIDLAFILPVARGRGVFRALYHAIDGEARLAGVARLWTHASLSAEPAFAAMGFSVIQRETVQRAQERLPRAKMEKRLA